MGVTMNRGSDCLLHIRVSQEKFVESYACDNAEFFHLISGQMRMFRDTQSDELRPGDFLLTPAGQRHSYSTQESVLYLVMEINERIARRYIDPGQLYCTAQMSEEENPQNQRVRLLLGRLLSLYLSEEPADRLLYESVCSEFLYHFHKYYRLPAPGEPDEETGRKREMETYIAQNYAYPIRLSDLAEHMHFSSVYLSRYFKKLFGVNFLEYLTAYRLAGAKEDLVKDSRRSIAQIALDNGFSNLNSFYTVFKSDCGLSPAEYRAQKEAEAAAMAADADRAKESLSAYLGADRSGDAKEEGPRPSEIRCCVTRRGERYAKVWNQVINVGEVRDLLRSDYQKHILMLHKELGFSHIRCWNLYAEEFQLGIRRNREAQTDAYDFTVLDRAFDFLAENGIRLYLDLGIKPYRLLKGQMRFVYGEGAKQVFETPQEQNRFIRRFIRHYRRRYGADELAGWYFEYWFDYEDPAEDAVQAYERQFRAIREIIRAEVPGVKVGGAGDDPRVLERMPDVLSCADFLSCYSYPDDAQEKGEITQQDAAARRSGTWNDAKEKGELSRTRVMQRDDYLELQAGKLKALQDRTNGAELHISEWSLSVSSRNMMNDSIFKAAYIVKNCIGIMDRVDVVAYWLGTDLYAEYTDTSRILFGGTGLLTRQSICKPAWYAFQMLNRLGKYRLSRSENAIVTANSETDLYILCHNYKRLGLGYYSRPEETLKAEDYAGCFEDREKMTLTFHLTEVPSGDYQLSARIINDEYGNAQKICAGSEERKDLTLNDIRFMQRRCMPHTVYEQYQVKEDRLLELRVELEPDEVRLLHVRRV